jgi:hypothetical protein
MGRSDMFSVAHLHKKLTIYHFNKITRVLTNIQNPTHYIIQYIVAYLLKARTVEKQLLLGNGYVTRNNGVIVRSGVSCAVRAEAI